MLSREKKDCQILYEAALKYVRVSETVSSRVTFAKRTTNWKALVTEDFSQWR